MKKNILLLSIVILLLACSSVEKSSKLFSKKSKYNVEGISPSPFIGKWSWVVNKQRVHYFHIWIGERNDSLLIDVGGVFYKGLKIQMKVLDENGYIIPIMKTPIPKDGNIIKGKISKIHTNFYNPYDGAPYKDVSFELIDKNTMIWRMYGTNGGYWPDSAIMKREDSVNRKFSNDESEINP